MHANLIAAREKYGDIRPSQLPELSLETLKEIVDLYPHADWCPREDCICLRNLAHNELSARGAA